MSGDLTGEDAFDRVLDRLETVGSNLRIARDNADNATSLQRHAETRAAESLAQCATMERHRTNAMPKLKELHQAAENALATLSDQGVPLGQESRKRLRAALNASAEYCDEGLPF
jgi:hypothetical protein